MQKPDAPRNDFAAFEAATTAAQDASHYVLRLYVTGTTPGGTLPALAAGSEQRRTLVAYNDEFRGTQVTLEVLLQSAGKTLASARKEIDLELGTHRDIPVRITVPDTVGAELALVLRTYKLGQLTFEEPRRFTITSSESSKATPTHQPLIAFE